MDFSSIPAYLDPSNWQQQTPPQQQQNHHHGSINNSNPLLPPPPLPPPLQPLSGQQQPPHAGQMGGSIRPGSMAERARMANIPMPEPALKCPRCESTNTKFCYFNNYSLSQPRHFCKTCRRYWTRGGALRSVPVGGGCRRNKRSKSSSASGAAASSSKSGASDRSSSAAATSSASSALSGGMTGTSSVAEMLGLPQPPQLSGLRFMSSIPEYGGGGLGLNSYSGIPATGDIGFHLGGGSSVLSGMDHPWRIPPPPPSQFPFFSGLDAAAAGGSANMYGHPFDGVELSSLAIGHLRSKAPLEVAGGSTVNQMGVKMEESGGGRQEMSANLVRQFNLGSAAAEHFNWGGVGGGGGGSSSSGGGGNAWTDMSGINNSSCSTTSAL